MKIDSHHHLWKYSFEQYPWMSDGMDAIRRDFLPQDLAAVLGAAGIDGAVTVQARQTIEETAWLLELASGNELMRGVVGWLPLMDPAVRESLERFAGHPKLKGVRHVLHDEQDDFYMLREDFNRGIAALKEFGLTYDILIFQKHLPQTLEFVDRHPNQIFVVDHIAKPRIRDGVMAPWDRLMRELARRENIYCKLSGMVTEANWANWTADQLRPYAEAVIEAFSPERVMYGSDWPVILVASEYRRWAEVAQGLISGLSAREQASIMGGAAARAYDL